MRMNIQGGDTVACAVCGEYNKEETLKENNSNEETIQTKR